MLERFGAVRVLLDSLERKRVVEFVNGNDKAKKTFLNKR
jgi:DNA primase catalytic subunit